MCGIVGIASNSLRHEDDLLIKMRDSLRHRGPDDAGMWWSSDYRVGLAHRRLSIIDLSSKGHQPMCDPSGKICITFNGEIYNYLSLRKELKELGHVFRTASDTEVIIEAYREWGVDCLEHFNGMFAFCLFDAYKNWMFLARDRAGEKPLFYYHGVDKFVFSSELNTFFFIPEIKKEIDRESLNYYLSYGYTPSDRSMVETVRKLPQAQAMIYEPRQDKLHLWQYWKLPDFCTAKDASSEEMINELEFLLRDSVKLRLTADVPVAILLSGGVDSSIVTALAACVSSRPVKTFTISFPGEGFFDEAKYARVVAEHFSTEHTEMAIGKQSLGSFFDIACMCDEPIGDSSMIPTFFVSRLIRQHAKVALGGDGGDELFGGYVHYTWLQSADRLRKILPRFARSLISRIAGSMPIGLKARNHLIGLSDGLGQTLAHFDMVFDNISRRRLLAPIFKEIEKADLAPELYKARICSEISSPLQQAMANDFRTYLVDDILTKVDRASMLNSLEVRAPWLDHRIIEFAFGRLPDSLKVKSKVKKILPRSLGRRLLPAKLDLSRKQGFSLPIKNWFKGSWGDLIISVLREADNNLFNKKFVEQLIREQRMGFNNMRRLYALTVFELWRRKFMVS